MVLVGIGRDDHMEQLTVKHDRIRLVRPSDGLRRKISDGCRGVVHE